MMKFYQEYMELYDELKIIQMKPSFTKKDELEYINRMEKCWNKMSYAEQQLAKLWAK